MGGLEELSERMKMVLGKILRRGRELDVGKISKSAFACELGKFIEK